MGLFRDVLEWPGNAESQCVKIGWTRIPKITFEYSVRLAPIQELTQYFSDLIWEILNTSWNRRYFRNQTRLSAFLTLSSARRSSSSIMASDRARLSYLIRNCDYSGHNHNDHNCDYIGHNCYHCETEAQQIGGRMAVPTGMFWRVHNCDW